jgi:hypothetical protein
MSVNLVKQWFPQLLSALDRAPMAGLLCATALLFGVTLAWTRASPNASSLLNGDNARQDYSSDVKPSDNGQANRLREGGEIANQVGYFQAAGDRLTFVANDNKNRYVILENSNLEQVAKTLADDPKQAEWIVSGIISEYRGGNFLMLHQAVLKP